MNKEITGRIHALLLTCIKVTAAGKHHAFLDYAGHVNWVSVYARPTSVDYHPGESYPQSIDSIDINLGSRRESPEESQARICQELDQAILQIAALLDEEPAHANA